MLSVLKYTPEDPGISVEPEENQPLTMYIQNRPEKSEIMGCSPIIIVMFDKFEARNHPTLAYAYPFSR